MTLDFRVECVYKVSLPYSRSTIYLMDHFAEELVCQILEIEWEKTRADYHAAGAPFGPEGLEIWAEYGQLTTGN